MSARFERRETTLGFATCRSIRTRSGLHERGLFFSFVHRTQQGLNALKTKGELLAPGDKHFGCHPRVSARWNAHYSLREQQKNTRET